MAWPESQTAFPPEGAQGRGAGYAWAGEALLASVAQAVLGVGRVGVLCTPIPIPPP